MISSRLLYFNTNANMLYQGQFKIHSQEVSINLSLDKLTATGVLFRNSLNIYVGYEQFNQL